MNKLLPNGNILASVPIIGDGLISSATKEVPPSSPEYEARTYLMFEEEGKKAREILAAYRKGQVGLSESG